MYKRQELNQTQYGKHFSDFDLWRMVTTNAAFAAGMERGVGMLKPGFVADVAIFDGSVNKDHRAVIAAEPKNVALVLRGGAPLYGDDALLNDAAIGGSSCEVIDVCGAPKRACVSKDTGGTVTLAAVKAAGDAFAPLFNCGAPLKEPSCVPSRPGEYGGQSTATDKDGDGIIRYSSDANLSEITVRDSAEFHGYPLPRYEFAVTNSIELFKRCLLYTSDAADERSSVDLGGRRIIKKKNTTRRRADSCMEQTYTDQELVK